MMKIFKIVAIVFVCSINLQAQEQLMPLSGNMNLQYYTPPQKNNFISQKTSTLNLDASDSLPIFEDFYYADVTPYPSTNHWADSNVFINTGFAIAPPSIGVATFDGLNKKGYPYNPSATSIVSAGADTLMSKRINLLKYDGVQPYKAADSIGFSFFYQAGGFGEYPETDDSLILEFLKPLVPVYTGTTVTGNGVWVSAWGKRGYVGDSTFKRAFVRITDTAFFHDGFKLRFRNKATTSGSLDHWNLDYITFKRNYSRTDTVYRDVAFGYVPRHLLKNYSAMPFEQYNATEMGINFSNFIRNNDTVPHNGIYQYTISAASSATLDVYNGGSQKIVTFNPHGWDSIPTHRNPSVNYTISPQIAPTYFTIKHSLNTTPDDCRFNDTVTQTLNLGNYYAYDDGSAEAGYYLNTYGAKLGLRYTVNVSDTLQAMDIFFDPIKELGLITSPGLTSFRMYVWAAGAGQPGTVILRDSVSYPTFYQFGHNKIPRYKLNSPLPLGPGTYYFGLQQKTAQPLNIGFDKNIDHKDALYYDVLGSWQQSGTKGSLMIHPVFGNAAVAIGIKENTNSISNNYLNLYPNPASDVLYVQNKAKDVNTIYTLEIYSTLGEKVKELQLNETISEIRTNDISSGLYFVVLKNNSGIVSQQKLIISK